MGILLEKIREEMAKQTETITETVIKSVSVTIDNKLSSIIEENKNLKIEVKQLQEKIKHIDIVKRRNNLLFFGVKESNQESLIEKTKEIIEATSESKIETHEISRAYRLGKKGENPRPILTTFTTTWKRDEILRKKHKPSSQNGVYIKEDFSKETLERRKELLPKLQDERAKGNIAYIRGDRIIIRDSQEDGRDKRKRSPSTSPNQIVTPPPALKLSKTNMMDYLVKSKNSQITPTTPRNK